MDARLINLIKEGIRAGHEREQIEAAAMALGYSPQTFFVAYRTVIKEEKISATAGGSALGPHFKEEELRVSAIAILTLPRISELLLAAWRLSVNNLSLLAKGVGRGFLALVLFVVGAVGIFSVGTVFLTGYGYLVTLVVFFLWVGLFFLAFNAIILGLLRALLRRETGENYRDHIWWSFTHIIGIGLTVFYANVLSNVGLFLLVIPGLIIVFYTYLALPLAVGGEKIGLAALVASARLVHGRFWPLVGRIIASALVLALVIGASVVLLSPVAIYLSLVLFNGLVAAVIMLAAFWQLCFTVVLFEAFKVLPPKAELSLAENTLLNSARIVIGLVLVIALTLGALLAYGFITISSGNHTYSDRVNLKDVSVDIAKKTTVKIIAEEMSSYYRNHGSYLGACGSSSDYVSCFSTADTYLLEVPLSKGFYCLDQSGYNEVTRRSSIIFGQCDREGGKIETMPSNNEGEATTTEPETNASNTEALSAEEEAP